MKKKISSPKRLATKNTVVEVSTVPIDESIADKTKRSLGIFPFGTNVIVDKRQLVKLQNLFVDLKGYQIPDQIYDMLIKHFDEIRKCVGLISFEEYEIEKKKSFPNTFEPTFTTYNCKCKKSKDKK